MAIQGNRGVKTVLDLGTRHVGNPQAVEDEATFKRPHGLPYDRAKDFLQKQDAALEVCMESGDSMHLAYSGFEAGVYDLGGTILCLFARAAVMIEGRNLDELATYFKQHMAEFVQERHRMPKGGPVPEDLPYIDRITLYKPDAWDGLVEKHVKSITINEKA